MGDFLEALKEMAGGWSAVKQIDKTGFDFREKRAAEQAARDQEVQNYQQQNEDWATKAATEADIGAPEGTDITSLIPSQVGDTVTRQRIAARAKGAGMQSKSYLKAQDLQNRLTMDANKAERDQANIRARGEVQQALLRTRFDMESKREPSPRDLKLLEEAGINRESAIRLAASLRPPSGGGAKGRPQLRQLDNGELAWFTAPDEGGQSNIIKTGEHGALPAGMREASARGGATLGAIGQIKGLLSAKPQGQEWLGPKANIEYGARSGRGKLGLAADVLGMDAPGAEQATFATAVASIGNSAIQDITGAQVAQHEVSRLFTEIPTLNDRGPVFAAKLAVTEYRLGIIEKLRRGELSREEALDQINTGSYQNFMQGGPAPSAPRRPPAGGGAGIPPRPRGVPPEATFDPVTRRWRL